MDVTLEITVDSSALSQALPRSLAADITYIRIAEDMGDTAEQVIIQDVVRIALDDKLSGDARLISAKKGSDAQVAFLSVDGAPLLIEHFTVPESGDSVKLTLTKKDAEVVGGIRQKLPAAVTASQRRRVRFVPISLTLPDYGRSQVRYAICASSDWNSLGLAQLFNSSTPRSTAVEWLGTGWDEIGAARWQSSPVSIDGRFDAVIQQPDADFLLLWWLQGNRSAIGAIHADLIKNAKNEPELPATLPAFSVSSAAIEEPACSCSAEVPHAATEAELADNPQVYSEDAGSFCKPFSSPDRVVSERSFYSIVRAEQPQISAKPSTALKSTGLLDFAGIVAPSLPPGFPPGPDLLAYARNVLGQGSGRTVLDAQHPVQWEDDVARYQASSVARGHILEHRVRWRSNGYSLGTVAKTLTLAPRQVKRVQKVEWERLEAARRAEATQQTDQVRDEVTRQRQIDDSVRAALHEWSFGTSATAAGGAAGGIGFFAEAVLGGAGAAAGGASSIAYTESGRTTSANEEQRLRDAIRRYADDLRRFESVVVNEVSQQETVTGTSEVLRNYNYAHALTVIYYQILRHLRVETTFAGVSECLFVPFAIKPFDLQRVYRWRESIDRALRRARYRSALSHVRDVQTDWVQSSIPEGRRADQTIKDIRGSLTLKLAVERPADNEDGSIDRQAWRVISTLLAEPAMAIQETLQKIVSDQRDRFYQANYAGGIAANWCDGLRISGSDGIPIPADFTLATSYRFGNTVRVDFTLEITGELAATTRANLQGLKVFGPQIDLPAGSIANLTSMSLTYTTDNFEYTVRDRGGTRDLVRVETGTFDPQGASVSVPLTSWEKVDQRAEITAAVVELVEHLNEHIEYYHKAIWWHMDRDRLYMLIDGFKVPGDSGVSIGSVVDREPIGIIGNSIVFRVSRGAFLGLGEIDTPNKLYQLYASNQAPRDPLHVGLPTDGLYAQAVLDPCPALEEHFGNFDWVLNQPDIDPATLTPELLATRRTDPTESLQPSPMPTTLINLQNAPEAPPPAGLQGVLNAVTDADSFRDLSGLAGNQANALASLQAASSLASGFGSQAASMAAAQLAAKTQATNTADQKLASIKRAQDKGLIDGDEASKQTTEVLRDMHSPRTFNRPDQEQPIVAAIQNASQRPGSVIEATSVDGQVRVAMGGGPDATSGQAASKVQLIQSLAAKALNIGLDALGSWKSEPNAELARILQDGLIAEAKKAAQDQTIAAAKRIPCGAALIAGIKVAVAFAEGAGAELKRTNDRLRRDYDEKTRFVLQSDEMSEESIQALRDLSSYQLNSVEQLDGVVLSGIESALSGLFDDAVDGLGKVFKDNRDSIIKQLARENELLSILNGGVSSALNGSPNARSKLVGFLVKGFAKQLPKSRLRDGLKTVLSAVQGTDRVPSELFAGLCMAVLDAETGTLKAALGVDSAQIKQLLMRELRSALNAGGLVAITPSTNQAVELDAAGLRIPSSLKAEIEAPTGALNEMTAEMQAAVDAFETVKRTLELRLQASTAQRLQDVRKKRVLHSQASSDNNDESFKAVTAAAQALAKLEIVIRDLARAAGDNRLDDRLQRLQFMDETLGAMFQFQRWNWDQFDTGSEPFASSIDLRTVPQPEPGSIDL